MHRSVPIFLDYLSKIPSLHCSIYCSNIHLCYMWGKSPLLLFLLIFFSLQIPIFHFTIPLRLHNSVYASFSRALLKLLHKVNEFHSLIVTSIFCLSVTMYLFCVLILIFLQLFPLFYQISLK